MKRVLQFFALALALVTVGFWLVAGANRGWTKTSVPVKTLDEVTGIEGISYEKKLVPGLDLLGAALAVSGLAAGASLLFRSKQQQQQPTAS